MTRGPAALTGVAWAVLATALWGSTFLGPALAEPVGPLTLVFGRYAVFGLLSIGVLIMRRRVASAIGTRRILVALHLGAVGYLGFYLCFSLAADIGGGVLASMATGVMPAAVTVGANLVHRETPWRRLIWPIMISTAGLVVLNWQRPEAGPAVDGAGAGMIPATLLALAACLLWSYFVVMNGAILRRSGAGSVDSTSWTALLGLGAFIASFVLPPLAVLRGEVSLLEVGEAQLIRFLVLSVLLATFGSWCASWCWNRASGRVSTVVLGQLIALETLFGAVFNLLLEQRLPYMNEVVGAVLVTTGVLLCVRSRQESEACSPKNGRAGVRSPKNGRADADRSG